MSQANKFLELHSMRNRFDKISPEELVTLINGVCLAIDQTDTSFHGNINAANISMDAEGNVGLGEALAEENVRYTADQIEYIAPEVFWDNRRSEQADVFSIGMLMYVWSNAGCLPFLYPDATATDRAEALRRRMSGEAFNKTGVSPELNQVIEKATAFKPEDRYASVAELQNAFGAFAATVEENGAAMMEKIAALKETQLQEASMLANILAAAEAATATVDPNAPKTVKKKRAPKKDEPIKKEDEKKKMSLRPLVAVLLIAAILMVAAVAMQFGADNTTLSDPNASSSTTPVIPSADPNATPDITPVVSQTPELPTTTDNPLMTPTPTPPSIVTIDTSRYNVVKTDISWSVAADNCIANGTNLVTINTEDEFGGLCALAEKYGLEMVWVGGFRKSGEIVWLNGESVEYMNWAKGEPSYRDANGTQENFLMLVKTDGVWGYKDVSDDPAAAYPGIYSGKMGYITEK